VRVGIDYLPAVSHAPGVGRYTRELVRALVALESGPDLALLEIGRATRSIFEPALGVVGAGSRATRVKSSLPRRAYPWLAPILRGQADRLLGGVDVFHHVLLPPLPVARAGQTLAIAELPAKDSPADALLARTLRRIDGVIVFSADYKERILSRYGLASTQVHRTPVGCDHWRRELAERPEPTRPPTVLVLGALRPARRHLAILRAVEVLDARKTQVKLVFVGRAGPAADELKRAVTVSPVRDRVTWHADLAESELPRLVGSASVLVHLSDDEGTAVTPLEAFALGVAVVASPLPAFKESLGGLATWIENAEAVREPARLADALEIALSSGETLAERDARELHARNFTWRACAEATAEVWRRVAGTS
jgi:glycosyltransferase involved in cell wall biosynthesis